MDKSLSLNDTSQELLSAITKLSGMPEEKVIEVALQHYHQGFVAPLKTAELSLNFKPSELMKLPKKERLAILAAQAEKSLSHQSDRSSYHLWQSGDFLDA